MSNSPWIPAIAGRAVGALLLAAVVFGPAKVARGQFYSQAVGGISVDAAGVLSNAEADHNGLRQYWLDNLQPVEGDLNQRPSCVRFPCAASRKPWRRSFGRRAVCPTTRFLAEAATRRIRVRLSGPELTSCWQAMRKAGKSTRRGTGRRDHRPGCHAVGRSIDCPAELAGRPRGGITCSIDPSAEGLARCRACLTIWRGASRYPAPMCKSVGDAIARELGPQTISFRWHSRRQPLRPRLARLTIV